jgi:hypothetical protein
MSMQAVRYQTGDMIVLRARALDGVAQSVSARIVACQPETRGAIRYRIRLEGENFDRTVGSHDIDTLASPASERRPEDPQSSRKPGSSWISTAGIRTRK